MYFYNEVVLVGTISKIISQGDEYWKVKLDVARPSKVIDSLMVKIPKFAYQEEPLTLNKRIRITGKLASPAKVVVCAETVSNTMEEDTNKVYITGMVYRTGRYKTVSNSKQRTDLTIMTQSMGERAIIPCIVWNRAAHWAAKLEEEAEIEVIGWLQSRKYIKHYNDETQEEIETYEVSASSIRRF